LTVLYALITDVNFKCLTPPS